jgi:steroid delta-isomerase-like uncharacterized protein
MPKKPEKPAKLGPDVAETAYRTMLEATGQADPSGALSQPALSWSLPLATPSDQASTADLSMRITRWILAALVLATPAPLPSQAAATAPPPAEAAASVAMVDRYIAAWNAHDAAKAASFMTDDVEYYDASTPALQKGRANAQQNVIQAFMTAVPDCGWRRTGAPVVGKEGVAFQWTFSGTNTGPWSDGTKATGKRFSINGLTLIRIREGKIAYEGDYYDAYGFFKQLGLAQ